MIEAYLAIPDKSKEELYKKNSGKNYDLRSEIEIYKDMKKINPDISTTVYPGAFLNKVNTSIFPFSGISNRETIQCNENGYYSIYLSDRYGFNNPDKEWNYSEIDYLIIGDSFASGECVNEPFTISGNFRSFVDNNYGVLNLGQGGNGPLVEYAALKEYMPNQKVNRILWLYYEGNDLLDLKKELKDEFFLKYLKDKKFSQNLKFNQKKIDKLYSKTIFRLEKLEEQKINEKKYEEISRFIKLFRLRYFSKNFISPNTILDPPISEFKKVLQLAKELSIEKNAVLYFVYLPSKERYLKNKKDKYLYHDEIINVIQELNIPIINMDKNFLQKIEDPLDVMPFRQVGHFNKSGYKKVSKKIFDEIKNFEKN